MSISVCHFLMVHVFPYVHSPMLIFGVTVNTERGVNQYQVQFQKKINLYFNQIIYSIVFSEQWEIVEELHQYTTIHHVQCMRNDQ